jgi:tetratricopeptide (TPR) repeat protein
MKPDPNNSYAEQQRAIVLYKAGRESDAQRIFVDARSRAKLPNDLNTLCWQKATAGIMLDTALQDCRDALKLSPDTGPYLDSLGLTLLKLGKLDEALDAYNKAILNGVGADSLMGRALVYLKKGDRMHADADAAAARKQSPNIDEIFAGYGLKFDGPPPVKAKTTAAKKPTIVSVRPE